MSAKFYNCVGMSREHALNLIKENEKVLEGRYETIGISSVDDLFMEETIRLDNENSTLGDYIEYFLFSSVDDISCEINVLKREVSGLCKEALECEDAVDCNGYYDVNRMDNICYKLEQKEKRLETLVQLKKDWLATSPEVLALRK